MNAKSIAMGVVAMVVATVLVVTCAVPIISDSVKTEDTFDNTPYGYYQMKELKSGDIWTYSNSAWTVNGETLTTTGNSSISVIAIDTGVVRQNGQVRGEQYSSNVTATAEVVTVNDADLLKINTNSTMGYADGYGATNNGDYILKTYTDTAYVNGDTPIWATGITNLTSGSSYTMVIHIEGTIDDGFTITANKVTNSLLGDSFTIGTPTVNYTAVSGYEDLYQIDSIVFDVTGTYTVDENTETATVNATYQTFVLPKEITAERTYHVDGPTGDILVVIPIMMVLGIVIGAVALFLTNRRD